jgi:hypothetical protein
MGIAALRFLGDYDEFMPAGVVCDGYRVTFGFGQVLSAGMGS